MELLVRLALNLLLLYLSRGLCCSHLTHLSEQTPPGPNQHCCLEEFSQSLNEPKTAKRYISR